MLTMASPIVFPAPAGMNRFPWDGVYGDAGVPRASGDEPITTDITEDFSNVFPAPAGMNRGLLGIVFRPIGVPRASGDEPRNSGIDE